MIAQIDAKFAKARPSKIWSRLLGYALFEGRPLTTRGRWINPLVFAGFRLWAALPFRDDPKQPIFILGVGRSGTTILGKILALHRDVGYLNEPKALWHSALGNDDLIGSYTALQGRYRLSPADLSKRGLRCLRRGYLAFLWMAGCRRVVDKYPELLFRSELLDGVFPDAHKIVLVRNGADICRSIERWSQTHGDASADWWGLNDRKWTTLLNELILPDPQFADILPVFRNMTRHIDRAAIEWIVSMQEALRLKDSGTPNLYFIRYEDMLADPANVLSHLFDVCNLPQDPVALEYACDVLHQRAAGPATNLHPDIQPLFDATMRQLDYQPD
ncbi:MAG: sulfotransferase [Marinosulfonomonas sp.]|nr:sulfotransferase [Marinosulfonomonas sp.]